jgi:hypothetical protein
MDPYLENPGLWPDVHHELISAARAILSHRLRPRYVVRIDERVYLCHDDQPLSQRIPDLRISAAPGREGRPFESGGGSAIETAEPFVATPVLDDEIREAYLTILDRATRDVVTVIEVLSPANKSVGSPGQLSFKLKRQQMKLSSSHWVEIDLLRAGERERTLETLPPHEYLVHVSRVDDRPKGTFWPIRLSQKLPVIRIPLRSEDPDVPLDLQSVLSTAYDRAGYDLELDYTKEPVPPLAEDWSIWSGQLLKGKGLRPS